MKTFNSFITEKSVEVGYPRDTYTVRNNIHSSMTKKKKFLLGKGVQAKVYDGGDKAVKVYMSDHHDASPASAWLDHSEAYHKHNPHLPVVHKHIKVNNKNGTGIGIAVMEKLHPLNSLTHDELHDVYNKTFNPHPPLPKTTPIKHDDIAWGVKSHMMGDMNSSYPEPSDESEGFVSGLKHKTTISHNMHKTLQSIHIMADDFNTGGHDLHSGNMMVRKHPVHGHQLVITDPLVDENY